MLRPFTRTPKGFSLQFREVNLLEPPQGMAKAKVSQKMSRQRLERAGAGEPIALLATLHLSQTPPAWEEGA
eukprot:1707488-Rhodomonas_salina.1